MPGAHPTCFLVKNLKPIWLQVISTWKSIFFALVASLTCLVVHVHLTGEPQKAIAKGKTKVHLCRGRCY